MKIDFPFIILVYELQIFMVVVYTFFSTLSCVYGVTSMDDINVIFSIEIF